MPRLFFLLLLLVCILATSSVADDRDAEEGGVSVRKGPERLSDVLSAIPADSANPEQSPGREDRYVEAIGTWLLSLPDFQQERARRILRDAHPEIHALRVAIRQKKDELAALSFDTGTSPEALPRLGQDLQKLRDRLREKLVAVTHRLYYEAGVNVGPVGGEGFWLATPDAPPAPDEPPTR